MEEIANNRHLQLAVYGFMLARPEWPWAGYYIVTTGNVLGPDAQFFPNTLETAASTTEEIWERSLVTYDWRRGQFAGGEVEVNAGAAPDERSEPPGGGLETRVPPDRFDPFRWLPGVASFQ